MYNYIVYNEDILCIYIFPVYQFLYVEKVLSWNAEYFSKSVVVGPAIQGAFHGKRIEKQKITLISVLLSKRDQLQHQKCQFITILHKTTEFEHYK